MSNTFKSLSAAVLLVPTFMLAVIAVANVIWLLGGGDGAVNVFRVLTLPFWWAVLLNAAGWLVVGTFQLVMRCAKAGGTIRTGSHPLLRLLVFLPPAARPAFEGFVNDFDAEHNRLVFIGWRRAPILLIQAWHLILTLSGLLWRSLLAALLARP